MVSYRDSGREKGKTTTTTATSNHEAAQLGSLSNVLF